MADLDDMIASMRGLARVPERAAELAAPRLEAIAKATASAGTSPTGEAWAPRRADGRRAMPNAAAAVRAEAAGATVALVLEGPEVYHQRAREDGRPPRRAIIPAPGEPIPPAMLDAIAQAVAQAVDEGGRR